MTNDENPSVGHGSGPGAELIEVASLPAAVDFVEAEHSSFLGRSALRVRTTPPRQTRRTGVGRPGVHGLGWGAQAYELVVDSERGVLLRSEARLGGDAFRAIEMTSVSFDGQVDDIVFEL